MKKMLLALALTMPLCAQAVTAPAAKAAPAATSKSAMSMLAQLPAFITKLDALRGKALTVAEKATISSAVSQGDRTVNSIQSQFLGGISKATGVDAAALGAMIPSATKGVSTSDLTSKIESKLGKKLGFLQSAGVKSANALRNNSLDSLKTSLSGGIAKKIGMDPAIISGLLPMLGL